MSERNLAPKEKNILVSRISETLLMKECILFSYLFGSFALDKQFNDIDVGIFINSVNNKSPLLMEMDIENELEDTVRIPVDVRIINYAPCHLFTIS